MPTAAAAAAEENFLPAPENAEPIGLSKAGFQRPKSGKSAVGADFADHLLHGDAHFRTAICHRTGSTPREGNGIQQGKIEGDPVATSPACASEWLDEAKRHCKWTAVCDPKRQAAGPLQPLEADEVAL